MDDDVTRALADLVQSEGETFYGDEARVESRLHERAGDHPAEIAVLATAVQAGVVGELLDVKPGLYDIAVGHLTGRMVRMHGCDPDAAHRAVEAWARALGAAPSRSGDVEGPYRAPERHQNGQVEVGARWGSIPWPWVAAVGAGVIGVVALIVLLRMVVGLVRSDGPEAAPRPAATSTTSTLPPATPVLTVPADLKLGTGDVQVTLLWADGNDLDLHVIDPSGAELYFSNTRSPTGGTLDHDDTAGCSSTGTHVENVFWPAGGAPPGRYRVFVKNYSSCGSPSRYSLQATVRGRPVVTVTGTVGASEGAQSPVSEFSF